jgi:NAD(P)-dependent dehydrogenase (short-subunit alcohol dehydrogenase family)
MRLLEHSNPKKVALFCRDDSKFPANIQQEIKILPAAQNKKIFSLEVDFLDANKITTKVHQMMRALDGKLDAIFFCHGVINHMGGIDSSLVTWDHSMKINVRSTMQILSICLPFLRMTQGTATILSSSAGEKPWPGHAVYNSIMASLNMMVRCAALENADTNVRINAVAPGVVRSFNARNDANFEKRVSPAEVPELLNQAADKNPLVRKTTAAENPDMYVLQVIEPREVASQMLWLGSPRASFMTGEVVVLDNGLQLTDSGYGEYLRQE